MKRPRYGGWLFLWLVETASFPLKTQLQLERLSSTKVKKDSGTNISMLRSSEGYIELNKLVSSANSDLCAADCEFVNIALQLGKASRDAGPFTPENTFMPVEHVHVLRYLDHVSEVTSSGGCVQDPSTLYGILRHIPRKNGLSSTIKRIRASPEEIPRFSSAVSRLQALESVARAFSETVVTLVLWRALERQQCPRDHQLGVAYFLKAMAEHLDTSERHGAILVFARAFCCDLYSGMGTPSPKSVRSLGKLSLSPLPLRASFAKAFPKQASPVARSAYPFLAMPLRWVTSHSGAAVGSTRNSSRPPGDASSSISFGHPSKRQQKRLAKFRSSSSAPSVAAGAAAAQGASVAPPTPGAVATTACSSAVAVAVAVEETVKREKRSKKKEVLEVKEEEGEDGAGALLRALIQAEKVVASTAAAATTATTTAGCPSGENSVGQSVVRSLRRWAIEQTVAAASEAGGGSLPSLLRYSNPGGVVDELCHCSLALPGTLSTRGAAVAAGRKRAEANFGERLDSLGHCVRLMGGLGAEYLRTTATSGTRTVTGTRTGTGTPTLVDTSGEARRKSLPGETRGGAPVGRRARNGSSEAAAPPTTPEEALFAGVKLGMFAFTALSCLKPTARQRALHTLTSAADGDSAALRRVASEVLKSLLLDDAGEGGGAKSRDAVQGFGAKGAESRRRTRGRPQRQHSQLLSSGSRSSEAGRSSGGDGSSSFEEKREEEEEEDVVEKKNDDDEVLSGESLAALLRWQQPHLVLRYLALHESANPAVHRLGSRLVRALLGARGESIEELRFGDAHNRAGLSCLSPTQLAAWKTFTGGGRVEVVVTRVGVNKHCRPLLQPDSDHHHQQQEQGQEQKQQQQQQQRHQEQRQEKPLVVVGEVLSAEAETEALFMLGEKGSGSSGHGKATCMRISKRTAKQNRALLGFACQGNVRLVVLRRGDAARGLTAVHEEASEEGKPAAATPAAPVVARAVLRVLHRDVEEVVVVKKKDGAASGSDAPPSARASPASSHFSSSSPPPSSFSSSSSSSSPPPCFPAESFFELVEKARCYCDDPGRVPLASVLAALPPSDSTSAGGVASASLPPLPTSSSRSPPPPSPPSATLSGTGPVLWMERAYWDEDWMASGIRSGKEEEEEVEAAVTEALRSVASSLAQEMGVPLLSIQDVEQSVRDLAKFGHSVGASSGQGGGHSKEQGSDSESEACLAPNAADLHGCAPSRHQSPPSHKRAAFYPQPAPSPPERFRVATLSELDGVAPFVFSDGALAARNEPVLSRESRRGGKKVKVKRGTVNRGARSAQSDSDAPLSGETAPGISKRPADDRSLVICRYPCI